MTTMVLAMTAALGAGCGGLCSMRTNAGPDSLCRSTDAGSTVRATVSLDGTTACRVTADAGTLTFAIDGTLCSHGNNPVESLSTINCDVSALPAGTYTAQVSGRTASIVLPIAPDAGLADCR